MENSKLIKILLKDIRELEELISDIKSRDEYDSHEIEFLHSRALGIRHLAEMLEKKEDQTTLSVKKPDTIEKPLITPKTEEEEEEKPEDDKIVELPKIPVSEEEKEQEVPESKEVEPERAEKVEPVEEEQEKEEPQEKQEEPTVAEKDQVDSNEKPTVPEEDEVDLEDEEEPKDKKTLGDKFDKEKSINDIISESNKLEYKLSQMPIKKLQSSMGINDRFLFTRELFDGDSDKFNRAVKELDEMDSIKQAVAYLKQNFKWKKNETSLKFVELVKRRFANG